MLAEGGYVKTVLVVDPTPLKDSSDGTSWYKISFENFQQIQYRYNMPYLYVNTKYVKKVPFLKRDKEFIAYFIQGRPPLFNVGDDFLKLKEITGGTDSGTYRRTKTKKPLNLHLEPKKESQTFILPAGSLIVDLTHVSLYAGVDAWDHPQLGHYEDMKDRFWYAIIEGESLKVVGWLDQDSAGSMLDGWNNDGEIIDDPSHGKGRYNFDWNEFDL
jgi:hypothetical protein